MSEVFEYVDLNVKLTLNGSEVPWETIKKLRGPQKLCQGVSLYTGL